MKDAAATGSSQNHTHSRRWPRYKVNVPIRVIIQSAMKATIIDGRGTSLSEGGMATVIAADKTFRKLATNSLDGATLASIAVSNGSLFIRSDSHLYRIG